MLVSIEGAPPTVNARPVECWPSCLRTYTTCRSRPLASSASRATGKRRGRCLLMLPPPHPPDDVIQRSGSAGQRDVFRAGTVWHLAMSAPPRLFPSVMRSCVFAGLAERHCHTVCSHCENVPSKYLNGTMSSRCLKHGQQTISPVSFSPPQPRHSVSVRALSSSSSSSPIRVRCFRIIRQGRHGLAVHLSA
jgi:hypothetical protein